MSCRSAHFKDQFLVWLFHIQEIKASHQSAPPPPPPHHRRYPLLHTKLPLTACRWQQYLCNETDGLGPLGSLTGYYLEGQQELHTGHSSSLATWTEAQRQLVELGKRQTHRSSVLTYKPTSCMCVYLLSHAYSLNTQHRASKT